MRSHVASIFPAFLVLDLLRLDPITIPGKLSLVTIQALSLKIWKVNKDSMHRVQILVSIGGASLPNIGDHKGL